MEQGGYLYRENINSSLGVFELRIDSTDVLLSMKSMSHSVIIHSNSYQITIKHTMALTDWLPVDMQVDRAEAWLIYVTKLDDKNDLLTVSFSLLNQSADIQAEADTGQFLTAIEFENGSQQLHIGTPDEEYYAWYGERAWMPGRLIDSLAENHLVITSIGANGLKSELPILMPHEQFYLHYILAEAPRRKSVAYPDEWDVATWYTVDQSRNSLENAWNEQVSRNK